MSEVDTIPLQLQTTSYSDLSRIHLMAIWWPRIVGVVTMIAAIITLNMAFPRRKLVFHRLVLGKITVDLDQILMLKSIIVRLPDSKVYLQ